ncbi:MAG: RNA polymerase sigma-70 factor [Chitinophagaceae bacterium]
MQGTMISMEEEMIWKRIQSKDEQAFEAYYKENYTRFFILACKYLKIPEKAEEMVHDVFIKIWLDGNQINLQYSLTSYIYRAVINRCLNKIKQEQREMAHQNDFQLHQPDRYVDRSMEENEIQMRIFQEIEKLPPQCRKVFQMSRLEALKQQDIANQLGISIKTVKNHMTHALKVLRKSLEGLGILLIWWVTGKF